MSKYCEDCKYLHIKEYADVNYDANGEQKQVLERVCFCHALPPVVVNDLGPRWSRPEVNGGDPACRYFESAEEETTTKGESWTKF